MKLSREELRKDEHMAEFHAMRGEAEVLADGELYLPKRQLYSHKGDYGRLLIVGGSVGYTGAPSLCARAAVRSGAGLVYLGVPESIYSITAVKNDEAMPFPLKERNGALAASAAEEILLRGENCDVCAIGPGLGRGEGTVLAVQQVIRECRTPLVLDADALYAASEDMSLLKKAKVPVILTPHEGEYLRMGGVCGADRAAGAVEFAEKYGCILVLKGHRTMIAFPNGEIFINSHGNPGMAKGGSGDVLTGVIAAMVGQFGVEQGVKLGVYLHGLAGDLCCGALGEYAMTAGDVIEALPAATMKMMKTGV